MLHRWCAYFARRLVAPPSVCVVQNALVAVCLATWCQELLSLLGTSVPVSIALLGGLTVGIAAGAAPIRAMRRLTRSGGVFATFLHIALAAWMVASPWILHLIDWAISQHGFVSLNSSVWNTLVLFALAVPVLGPPAFLAAQLTGDPESGESRDPHRLPLAFLGAAAGLTIWGVGLAQILGPYPCGVVAAGLGLVIAAIRSYKMSNVENAMAEPAPVHSSMAGEPDASPALHERTLGIAAFAATIGCGGWLAALGRLIEQLMPATIYLACFEATGLCVGIAAGLWLTPRRRQGTSPFERTKVWILCGAAIWGIGALAAFPLCITAELWLNSYVTWPALLLAARGAWAAIAVVPAGGALALCLASAHDPEVSRTRWKIGSGMVAALVGYWVISTWGFGRFAPESIVIGLAWWTVAAAAPAAVVAGRTLFAGWPQGILAGGAVAVIVIAPVWRTNFDSRRSAKLLFNANAAYAYRGGLNPSLLMSLDESRHMATVTGENGIFTVWRFGGHQLQIRENGIPRGVVSTDAEVFPRFVPEILQSVLPLALHDKAERLLLLGLGSSESLSTALAFPVPQIVCLEADAGLVRVVNDIVAADAGMNPLNDERVALSICEPALGLAAVSGQFDVIVSSPEHLGLIRSQPYLTAEFYLRAARKLSPQGVFCQRLQLADFGPRTLRTMVRTLQSVFRDVLALEVAPGEMIFAATNDNRGLIRPGLTARFEAPHVRAVLAQSGIDWTVVLNLTACNQAGLEKFVAKSPGPSNTAGEGRLPFSLPREVMRWGPKTQEVHEALAPSRGRILAWVGEEAESQVLVRRLAEVQGQLDLMTKYADQYWAYRASLRDQVKEKPRSQIRQVGATDDDGRMHPEDRRRLRYFQVLGQAVKSGRAADIERLAAFAAPYDPLISYFVHEEAAELYSRSAERDVARELRHRLHATFYSSPRDASLHNVVAALTLMREHPEAEPDPLVRWDDLNALLQALKLRWEARAGVRPTNVKEAINDIDTTVLVVEQTFQVLENLATEAGLPNELCRSRRSVLEKTLIRPIKAYQLELLPHLRRRNAVSDDGEEESKMTSDDAASIRQN